ncbi:MAG: energy-coupling factor ABC transporter permease [Ghiorsea sp.]
MHVEVGFVAPAKVMIANVVATGVLAYYVKDQLKNPLNILRTAVAALFFTVFMQSFHMQVGPSELHFVGAMAMYLTLGFIPTLFGFAIGLLLQGVLFEPQDLAHLAVNSLSLVAPLVAVHYTLGKKLLAQGADIQWSEILKIDAAYYAGVTLMVGFWLAFGEVATSFSAWAAFATSYLAIVAVEPVFTYATVRLLKKHSDKRWVQTCFAVADSRA